MVTHLDHVITYHTIPPEQGWKIDSATREIKIGKGFPRTVIPMDNVRYYSIEEYEDSI